MSISDSVFAFSEYAPTVATIKPHLILATYQRFRIRFVDWPPSPDSLSAKDAPAGFSES